MPQSSAQHETGVLPLDFAHRASPALLPEWMDEPCSPAELRACLRDLARCNRVTLAHGPTLRWLARVVARHAPSAGNSDSYGHARSPLHILDVGCGGGDLLRRVARWAKRRRVAVQLTGVDLNPVAIDTAKAQTGPGPAAAEIEYIVGNAYAFVPERGVDIIVSSLMTHHLEDAEIVRLLGWMNSVAQRGWFINDLYRSPRAHLLFRVLARAFRWHRFVQHDGPVSIRRSFRVEDWERLCAAAGLPLSAVRIERRFPGRLCVGVLRESP